MIVGIKLAPSVSSSPSPSEIYQQIEKVMKDPYATLLISDHSSYRNIYLFCMKRKYRKIVLYHIGKTPRYNPYNFPTKGGFETYTDLDLAIELDSKTII
jgi:hypothetical protein